MKTTSNKPKKKTGSTLKKDSKKPKMTVSKTSVKKKKASSPEIESEPEVENKYEEKLIHLVDEIEEKVSHLKVKGKDLTTTTKKKLSEQWDSLKINSDEVNRKLDEVKGSTAEKWQVLQQNADKKLDGFEKEATEVAEGIKGGLKYLISKFRKAKNPPRSSK